jgi:hypothetical protein
MTPWSRRNFLAAPLALAPSANAQSPAGTRLRFAIVGDRTGTAMPQIYSRVWREISLLSPDFALTVGDTIEGTKDETAEKEWDEMEAVWQRYRKFPAYFTPGNHDIWSPASEKIYTRRTARPPQYSVVEGNALFVVLDNSRTDALSPEQLAFCEAELRRHAARAPKFVFFHKPFWLVPIRVGQPSFAFHDSMLRHKVDYVVSGHGHQLVHLERDGVHYLEVGSSGGSILRGLQMGQGFKDGWFYHYLWGVIDGPKVEFTGKEIGPGWGQGRMFPLSAWTATGPQFDPSDPALPGALKL